MRVQELIEKRAKVWETAKNFVDTHEDKNGNLSAEDKETYSRMEAEIEELTNSIERQQRAERREQELSKPVNSPITGKPYSHLQKSYFRFIYCTDFLNVSMNTFCHQPF